MDILISFYNTFKVPGYPCLGLLNAETMELRVLELPPEVPQTGIGGLAAGSGFVLTGLQHTFEGANQHPFIEEKTYASPPGLLFFDRKTFTLLHYYIFQLAKDVHSMLLSADEAALYVVSTGTDEVIELQLNGTSVVSEKVFWRPEPEGKRSDNHHLNSIYEWQGDMYVSGFGKMGDGESWNNALNGFIYNITKGEYIVQDLKHPHSLTVINGRMICCESRKQRLRFIDDETTIDLPGYVRGLCKDAGNLFVGSSALRKKSKSTGKLVQQSNSDLQECTISRISLQSLKVEESLSLRDYAFEIYDLMPVAGTSLWPVGQLKNYRQQMEQIWLKQVQSTLQEIRKAVPKGEKIILVDEDAWQVDDNNFPDRQRLHFLQREGKYWGPPENDEAAILELSRMEEEENPGFIAFGWPSFWWLDYYPQMHHYVKCNYTCVIRNERVIIFGMRTN